VAIHPTAIVDSRAEIDADADVGPYVVIEGPVRLGPRTRVMAHAYLAGHTTIGTDNVIHPGASIGNEPMDLAYRGAPTEVVIGDRNVFREQSEVHRATQEGTRTVIGSDCYLMSRAHVAHNCAVADRVIVCSGALIAGHVDVGPNAFISGNCVVHQYVRIGRLVMMRGGSRAGRDLPPFSIIDRDHTVRGLNRVGLRRAGFTGEQIRALSKAFRMLFRVRLNLPQAVARVRAEVQSPEVDELLAFVESASSRGVAIGPPGRSSVDAED